MTPAQRPERAPDEQHALELGDLCKEVVKAWGVFGAWPRGAAWQSELDRNERSKTAVGFL